MSVALTVSRLVIETEAERRQAEKVPAVLRDAIGRLGAKLAALPSEEAALLAGSLERLEVEFDSVDGLLGPRGAERLAEEIYLQLTRRIP